MALTAFKVTLCVLQTVVLILVFVASVSCMFVKFPAAIQKTFLMRKLSIKRRKVEERFHTSSIVQIYHMRLLQDSLLLYSSIVVLFLHQWICVFMSLSLGITGTFYYDLPFSQLFMVPPQYAILQRNWFVAFSATCLTSSLVVSLFSDAIKKIKTVPGKNDPIEKFDDTE